MPNPLNIPPCSYYVLVTDENGDALVGSNGPVPRRVIQQIKSRLPNRDWWAWFSLITGLMTRHCRRQYRLMREQAVAQAVAREKQIQEDRP